MHRKEITEYNIVHFSKNSSSWAQYWNLGNGTKGRSR